MYASFLVSLYGSLFYVHNLSLLVETRRTQYLAEHTTLQNILPCRTYYLVLPCRREKDRIHLERGWLS
jgi:hypothetical protein